jgi:SAM-dependent methyltransferase
LCGTTVSRTSPISPRCWKSNTAQVDSRSYVETITPQALAYFRTHPGQLLLSQAVDQSNGYWQAQESLRRRFPVEMCRAALSLIALRRQAAAKFSQAERMFFDRDGLEMASGEETAAYRAARLGSVGVVIDLCCGIGGDLVALAERNRVCGVDCNRTRLEVARLNAEALGVGRAMFALADARHVTPRADAVFIDPARRHGQRRARRGSEYSPPLSLVHQLRRHVANVIVKVSPAVPEEDLDAADELNFVSSGGQCREAVLYFGQLARGGRSAVVLPGPHILEAAGSRPEVEVAAAGKFLYDPDPAVVRAHVVEELAADLGAWKLSPFGAYLSGDRGVQSPFARTYTVLESLPFNRKRLQQHLLAGGMYAREIKKRNVPLDAAAELRQLKAGSGEIPVSLVLERVESGTTVLICQRLHNSAD